MARVSAAKRDDYLQEKREVILKAAFKVIMREGFEKASIDKIAAAAKIGKGSMYLYFKSKEDLYIAVLQERSFLPRLKEMSIQPAETFEQQLRNMITDFAVFAEESLPMLKVFLDGMIQYPEYARDIYREFSTEGIRYIKPTVDHYYPDVADKVNLSVLMPLLIASVFTYVITQKALAKKGTKSISREEWVNEVVSLFMARIQ